MRSTGMGSASERRPDPRASRTATGRWRAARESTLGSILESVGLLLAGVLAAALVHEPAVARAGTALGRTLAVLPLVAAALAVVARVARRAGSVPLPRWVVPTELAALAFFVPTALVSPALGLPDLVPVVAAGLFALLLLHAVAQLAALAPLLARGPRSPHWLFLALPLVVYGATLPWQAAVGAPDGDEPYYLLLAHSLAEDGDVDLADDYASGAARRFTDRTLEPQPGDPVGSAGEVYSRHDPLLPLLLAPALAVGGRLGSLLVMALFAAGAAWATLRLLLRLFPSPSAEPGHPDGRLVAFGLFAFAPPVTLYALQVWVELPGALLLAWAAAAVLDLTPAATDRAEPLGRTEPLPSLRARRAAWIGLVVALVALPLLKLRFLLVSVGLVGWMGWRLFAGRKAAGRAPDDGGAEAGRGGLRAPILLATALVALAGVILLVNRMLFGSALKVMALGDLTDLLGGLLAPMTVLRGLAGLFWDPAFGLFGAAPLWLLLVPGLVALLADRRTRRRLGPLLGFVALPTLLAVASRTEWYGGWAPPFRYALVLLPLLTVAVVPLFPLGEERGRHPGRALSLGFLGSATVLLSLVWMAVPGWTYDLADGGSHLLDALATATGADVLRAFPSYVRPRLASWLWPPLSALLVWALWRTGRERPAAAARPTLLAPGWVAGGVVLLALSAAALPTAARLSPSRTVELEDPWVDHRGGHLYPEPWTVARIGYTGGWVLRPGESATVPVVVGGGAAEVTVRLQPVFNNPDPFTLELTVGAGTGERLELVGGPDANDGWQSWTVTVDPWPGDAPLRLATTGPSRSGGAQNGVLVDRLEIDWR